MLEFTGERVIPGLVDPDLFNEHLARYRFAARFAVGMRVLDAGCGAGYGTAELANAANVVGLDISPDAVAHARQTFSRPGVDFLQGACESLPFADSSFDLLLAFEVIEHLEGWQDLLTEARRVLRPSGVLLVSTPNKAWYTESRGASGPNPYHVHEFEYREFEAVLLATFPHVHLWTQNHAQAIAFVPAAAAPGVLDAPADANTEQADFFLAACSQSPIAGTAAFAWLPSAGNILRERQHHIALLESEIQQKNAWLDEARNAHGKVLGELEQSNAWAIRLNGELDTANTLVAKLQREIVAIHAGYREQLSRLDAEASARIDWIHDLEAQLARGHAEIERQAQEHLAQKDTLAQRTHWAQSLENELTQTQDALLQSQQELKLAQEDRARLTAELHALEDAKWVRAGRKLQLIPEKE